MKKNPDILQEKIRSLETRLKDREALLKKYRKTLDDSNSRIKKIAQEMRDSLSLIRDIHKNLLPVKLPHIPGFEFSYKFLPAEAGVSGDFFNVVKIENSMKFGVLLSSCNSYAVTSLFLSSFLRNFQHLKKYKKAKDFVSFVSQKVAGSLKKKEKIDLFYGIISLSSFKMDYCLAGDIFVGHKAWGEEFEVLPSSAGSLYERDKLKGGQLSLHPKDVLLFCSPGVASRANQKGESFGKNHIIQSAAQNPSAGVLEIRQNVLFACDEFGKKQALTRDCSVLALKAKDRILRVIKP